MSETTDQAVYKTLLESTQAIPWKIDWKTMTFAYIGPQIEHLLGWTQDSWISADDWANRMQMVMGKAELNVAKNRANLGRKF